VALGVGCWFEHAATTSRTMAISGIDAGPRIALWVANIRSLPLAGLTRIMRSS
jgi:hypothetical protein